MVVKTGRLAQSITFPPGQLKTYTVRTYGSLDTYMYLYDTDRSTILFEDDNRGEGNNAEISRLLNGNTWYYVRIRASNSTSTGGYSIAALNWWNTKSANSLIGDAKAGDIPKEEILSKTTLIAYPNPNSGILTIESGIREETTYIIDLINIIGHLILNQEIKVTGGRFEIDMTNVSVMLIVN